MANGLYVDEGIMQMDVPSPDILALGDSWFWYHASNLLIPIANLWGGARTILAQGGAGVEAVELARGGRLAAFTRVLRSPKRMQAVLLSAGGNDFAGIDDMSRILGRNCGGAAAGAECFDAAELKKLIFTEVLGAYRTLMRAVEQFQPSAFVYVHNYDYAIPTGIGILGFGHWLKEPMDRVGVPGGVQQLAVNYLIDTFSDMLAQLQSEFPDRVVFIDSTRVLSAGDWANELHPEASGFEKLVAQAWAPELVNLQ